MVSFSQVVSLLGAGQNEVSSEKGDLSLFALFLREEVEDKWDVVVSAPWLEANKKEALSYLADKIKSHLKPEELLSLSRIVLIDVGNPALDAVHRAIRVEHGTAEVVDSDFFGLHIKHAYIITLKRVNPKANGETH
jgi:hypothetical protein